MRFHDPIQPFLKELGALILDGGLASELEARGHDLADELWSARLLDAQPDAIREVHRAYFEAGADCAISASYQATIPGFMAKGYSRSRAVELLQLSVTLALQARDSFWADEIHHRGRLRPLVVASIGPYGAYLADGSEYLGAYDLSEGELVAWHRERWQILAQSGADLLACETIPSYEEMLALRRLLLESPGTAAWFSFSCRDGQRINDGTEIAKTAEALADVPQVVGVGINCTPPRFIPQLIGELRRVTDKPVVVYPNSGEHYDGARKQWTGLSSAAEFGELSSQWLAAGAALIGGCCRTGPAHIRKVASQLRSI